MLATVGTGAIVAIAGLPALASSDSSDDSGHGRQHVDGAPEPPGRSKSHPGHKTGHGPPPWAHGHGAGRGGPHADGWKELTPEQRATLMAELARRHTDAMKEWGRCVAAERDDCVRPVPPGLAKRTASE